MRALVVVGSNLTQNTSANLCHRAYVQGLARHGCAVDVLTVGTDRSQFRFGLPNVREFYYPMESLYERLSSFRRKKTGGTAPTEQTAEGTTNQNGGLLHRVKHFVHTLYGPYEVYRAWETKARRFAQTCEYDLVVSLSFPPVSHHLTYHLLQKKRIQAKHWIQLWEDPWCLDLVFRSLNDEKAICRAEEEEHHLLRIADEVLYVSPITLQHQQELFPDCAAKMKWLPVPTYYSNTSRTSVQSEKRYGYFGDYSTKIRNLTPFYQAALQSGVPVNICGYSDRMLVSNAGIRVRPRISLEELRPIEDDTNVLVFLSNLRGGQIPGKIYQYAATYKTVLFILDGTAEEQDVLRSFFGQFHRFVFCENTVKSITDAIGRIERGELGDVVNRPLDDFAPERIIQKILEG